MINNSEHIWTFPAHPEVNYKIPYDEFCADLQQMDNEVRIKETVRRLFQTDLFALLFFGMGRRDINNHGEQTQFLVDVCQEVEEGPATDTVDLWAREHFKSTIITQGKTIQDILNIPNVRIGIFSHTRPIAKDFVRPVKALFENQNTLTVAFPEIFWDHPRKEAPVWSMDSGLTLKRESESNTCSLEAWGLVDGMPTALSTNTPVLTTKGWKRHGDLVPGDFVYDDYGKSVKVLFNTGSMINKECYEVQFKDTTIIAGKDHLWPVDRAVCPRNKNGKQLARNKYFIREFVPTQNLPTCAQKNKSLYRGLPRTPILELSRKKLQIDPYLLGIYLGDGSSNQCMITTQDKEIIEAFNEAGFSCIIKQDRDSYKMYNPQGFWKLLKEVGVAYNKHIPEDYLYTDTENRRNLLQGLMDSDGTSHPNGWGQCSFYNTNINLINGVHFLAVSLGMQPTKVKRYIRKNPNHKDIYVVTFLGVKNEKPFRLKRKLERCRDERLYNKRYATNIKKIKSVPINCIQVNSTTGIYLAGEALVPTHNSKHFDIRVYDDVITETSVYTPEQMRKAEDAFRMSDNLGTKTGHQRIVGTIYSHGDYYSRLREESELGLYPWYVRVKPWYNKERYKTENIKHPVLLSSEKIKEKQRKQGPRIFAAQMELDPTNEEMREFRESWLEWYQELPQTMNEWLFVDPANEQKKDSDYTVMAVLGIDVLGNRYLLDMIREKLSLHERWESLKKLVQKWPKVRVYYEKYGMQADISYIKEKQRDEGTYFKITEIAGRTSKLDRIRRLQPICADSRFYLPSKGIIYHGEDLVLAFIRQEYSPFPFAQTFDMIDAVSRIEDPEVNAIAPQMPNSEGDYRRVKEEYLEQYECEDI